MQSFLLNLVSVLVKSFLKGLPKINIHTQTRGAIIIFIMCMLQLRFNSSICPISARFYRLLLNLKFQCKIIHKGREQVDLYVFTLKFEIPKLISMYYLKYIKVYLFPTFMYHFTLKFEIPQQSIKMD